MNERPWLVSILLLGGCASTPTVAATGANGVYAHYAPPDGAAPADGHSGLVGQPAGWPPKTLYDDCSTHDELKDFEASIGMSAVACPTFQEHAVAAVADAAPEARAHHKGFNAYCYPLGSFVLIVETTELLGKCKHVVGVGAFRKADGT